MIGKNAGVVWRTLRDNKTVSMKELVELTGLNPTDLAFAIGWLARENKIEFCHDDQTDTDSFFITMNIYI